MSLSEITAEQLREKYEIHEEEIFQACVKKNLRRFEEYANEGNFKSIAMFPLHMRSRFFKEMEARGFKISTFERIFSYLLYCDVVYVTW